MRLLLALMIVLAVGGIARADGTDIFNSNCVVCHQADATGLTGMYPPLADSIGRYVAVPEGRAYLVHVVSFGMTGPIAVHDQLYNGVMYPWPNFTDEDIAQVLNYVLTRFNVKLLPKAFSPLTADEVKRYRSANPTMGDVHTERHALMKTLAAQHSRP